ncbi:hypothetical protein CALCODRAFT_476028 [Calocera cornea HHB12733]|uniref:T6SS Phospholipase effector Tle1-like catalytic domain-containing protein n=1 Tax=Calocera cornea HHB12733 TaxID=1353952 RepID=A0A165D9M3_9BASI|nr:hypothetical protein CALCODRAFT_476028 [Calocera cornea HHB12733]
MIALRRLTGASERRMEILCATRVQAGWEEQMLLKLSLASCHHGQYTSLRNMATLAPLHTRTFSDATGSSGSMTPVGPEGRGRRLIVCFDGTSNLFDQSNTNVVKLVSYLKKDDLNEQQVYYQTGVGTYIGAGNLMPFAVKLAKLADEAVAWDIGNHIMGGYNFLMQNWTPGSKISIFGFSRGAYTARALAGMLHKVGLLSRSNEEQIPFAYNMYAKGSEMCDDFKRTFCNPVEVDFLGVWDTVSSVGVLAETDLPFTDSAQFIRVFRHAVSLDERRCKFKANLCELSCGECKEVRKRKMGLDAGLEEMEDIKDPDCTAPHTDVEEVWFAGGHGDVGGGCVTNNVDHSANRIPLVWMIREIVLSHTGITFDPAALERDGILLPTHAAQEKTGNPISRLDQRYEQDVRAPIHDWLNVDKKWWLLEILPFTCRVLRKVKRTAERGKKGVLNANKTETPVKKQEKMKKQSKWKLSPKPNYGHYRDLPTVGLKVHFSVLERHNNDPRYTFRWSTEPEWIQ